MNPDRRRVFSRVTSRATTFGLALLGLATVPAGVFSAEPNFPVLPQWRSTAQKVAAAGVPLSALAPNAPDSHVVQPGDTLWDIARLFLTDPWRWPELWGMNLDSIKNPHLIYPGQVLVLLRGGDGTARLAVSPGDRGIVRLSPKVRSSLLDNGAIAAIPLHLIGPFLDEAVVFDERELERAPRIVAMPEGRVMVSLGELAYVRGERGGARDFRLFREPRPLTDPRTNKVLGYEGRYVGRTEFVRAGGRADDGDVVPDSYRIASARIEAQVGDRLSPVPPTEMLAYVPHAPAGAVEGSVVEVYGDGLMAGTHQIVSINKGLADGMERGHVLALWRAGQPVRDRTEGVFGTAMTLPDEKHGQMFVFRVFDHVSYALVMTAQVAVQRGDKFTNP